MSARRVIPGSRPPAEDPAPDALQQPERRGDHDEHDQGHDQQRPEGQRHDDEQQDGEEPGDDTAHHPAESSGGGPYPRRMRAATLAPVAVLALVAIACVLPARLFSTTLPAGPATKELSVTLEDHTG